MNKKKELFLDLAAEIIGSILCSAALYNFAVYAGFPMSGFSGITLIIYRLWGIPLGVSSILLNIPVALLCYKTIGKNFTLKSLRCMLISSIFIDYIAPLFPVYTGERMLAALATGILGGVGLAIIFARGSSTGGIDFLTMAIKNKYPHLKMGVIVFVVDFFIILLGSLIFKDVDGIIYGLIINTCYTVVIDKLMYGLNAGKVALIVTTKGKEICNAIDEECKRGSTILNGKGGYKGEEKEVVMVACNDKEMYQLEKVVKKVDKDLFMIIMEASEVHGEGFKVTRLAESEIQASGQQAELDGPK